MKIQIGLLIAILLFVVASVEAQPYAYRSGTLQPPIPDYPSSSPVTVLENGLKKMREFLAEGGADDPARLYTFIDDEVAPYFDFDRMAAWVARPYYQRMTDKQKLRFKNRFKEVFLKTLAREIGSFREPQPRIDFLRPRRMRQNLVEVSARVIPANGFPFRLTFRFRRGQEGWKVIDASRNGSSAVLHYRQYFMNMVKRQGPKVLLR